MSLTLGEHRGYLADDHRLVAYRRALEAVVRPGDVVLDLGTGTGVLGVLAARAGAGRVYAVDATAMLGVARAIVRANGLDDRITLIKEHSLRVELPERVDVVVADQLGPFGLEAGMFEAYADARRRHLKPGGTLIPGRLDLLAAPITSEALWADVAFWDRPVAGVDLAAMSTHARHVRYFGTAEPGDLLGAPAVIAALDPGDPASTPIRAQGAFAVDRPGTLHGVAGWFGAELAPGIRVRNGPADEDRLARSHIFLPLHDPQAVAPGDTVALELQAVPPDVQMRWTITVTGADGTVRARSRHATLQGSPLLKEDLLRTRPDHVPQLGARGRARRTVLELIDGTRTLADIEAALAARHPEIAGTPEAASAFVARILAQEA